MRIAEVDLSFFADSHIRSKFLSKSSECGPTLLRCAYRNDIVVHGLAFCRRGQVTVMPVGPCTNLAIAIRLAPEIIPLIKRVVYMGGAFDVPGNTTPAAEFNWWFDPEAAKMTVRSPFADQLIVELDVWKKYRLTALIPQTP